jgi:hypothetical protein
VTQSYNAGYHRSIKMAPGHYKVSLPVVVFGKRFYHGGIGIPLVVDERGDHFSSPEFFVDLSVQTERFLCFQPFSDLGEKAREYLKDKYFAEPRWKYEMIETFLDEKKRIH